MKYTLIKSIEQHNLYASRLWELLKENEEKYQDEIHLLQVLVLIYDGRVVDAKGESYLLDNGIQEPSTKLGGLSPVTMLRLLMEEHKINNRGLAAKIGCSPSLISEVLTQKKIITRKLALKLSTHFSMQKDAFLHYYDLNP